MRAVQYQQPCGELRVVDLPEPGCPDDGVVIRVLATGVCRSDWHAWQGHDPVPLPMVPGHEFAGRVARVGSDVTRVRVGDRVTVPFACGCGRCGTCVTGGTNVCPHQTQPGFTHDGSFAKFVAVRAADTNVVPLPDDLPDEAAVALGCRFATAYRAVVGLGRLRAGEHLVVFGAGGVGLSAVAIGVALEAEVTVVDVSRDALNEAGRLGAAHLVEAHPSRGDTIGVTSSQLRELTGGGAHVTVDALGSPDVLRVALESLRARGRHAQVGLLLGEAGVPPVPMGLVVARELQVLGVHGLAAADYPAMLRLAARLDLTSLVGRVIGLDEAPLALRALGEPGQPAGLTVVRP